MDNRTPPQLPENISSGLAHFLESAPSPRCSDKQDETPDALVRILNSPQNVPDAPIVTPDIQDGVVAFIDALGTSALMGKVGKPGADAAVARNVYSTTMGMVDEFQTSIADLKASDDRVKYMVISDSFVIAVPYTPEAISKLFEFLATFQYRCLMSYSQALRGAVSKGKLIGSIPENRIIGSAFIEAHKAEKEIAFFPRIVIDNYILEDANLQLNENAMPVAIDKDGIRYVDFVRNEARDKIASIVDGECQNHANELKCLQKWNWLKTFLEQKSNDRLICCKTQCSPTFVAQV